MRGSRQSGATAIWGTSDAAPGVEWRALAVPVGERREWDQAHEHDQEHEQERERARTVFPRLGAICWKFTLTVQLQSTAAAVLPRLDAICWKFRLTLQLQSTAAVSPDSEG